MKATRWHLQFAGKRPLLVVHYTMPQVECIWHWHPEAELVVILKGTGRRRIGGHTDIFKPEDVVMIGGGLPHAYWGSEKQDYSLPEEDWGEALVVHFGKEVDSQRFEDMPKITDLLNQAEKRGITFGTKTARKLKEAALKMAQSPLITQISLLYQLLDIMAHAEDASPLTEEDYLGKEGIMDPRLKLAVKFIEDNHQEGIKIEDVSKAVKMKPDTFSRWFKKHTSKNYRDYLVRIRLEHVQQELTGTNKTILEAAFAAGFENLANFNRLFKKHHGITPNEYRKREANRILPKKLVIGKDPTSGLLSIPEEEEQDSSHPEKY